MARSTNQTGYEPDSIDGYRRQIVGDWVHDKHARLTRYVGISRAVRNKFTGSFGSEATLIDLYCGPGKIRTRDANEVLDGSAVAAWNEAAKLKAPFSRVFVADLDEENVEASRVRLQAIGARVEAEVGPAAETVRRIVPKLNPHGLHFAFLDPFDLKSLPFEIIETLARVQRIDLLIHVSTATLRRNIGRWLDRSDQTSLDVFAPGWRDVIDPSGKREIEIRGLYLRYWCDLVGRLGLKISHETFAHIRGPKNAPLYVLAFAARNPKAVEFWNKLRISEPHHQASFDL